MDTLQPAGWFGRALVVSLVALVLAGASLLTLTARVSAVSPGDADPAAVTNLAPGNAEIDIDAFWRGRFVAAGLDYSSPAVRSFVVPVDTGCGTVGPAEFIAFYCAPDGAVYWSISAYEQASLIAGDAAWVNVMAHEWSHHVQLLLGANTPWRRANDPVSLELEATCMGGVYVADARARDLVDDAMIAQMVGMFIGDASHGSTEQVQAAFLSGLDRGADACGLGLLAAATQSDSVAINTTTTTDADAIPLGTEVRVTAAAVNLRTTPSVSAPVGTVLSPANRLEITGPAQTADGYTWWPVTDQTTGESGFVAASFLAI